MGKNSLVKHIYICDGVQKNFDYQFESFSKTSIKVFIDNLMIKSGYEIVPFSDKVGGKIIFNTPPLKGKVLSIIRELDFSRSCDFQTGGIFRAEDLNYELNYNIACLNQVNDVLTLAVKLSPLDTKINPVLPKAKAGYAIVWNDTEDGFSNLDVNITEQVRYVEDCTNLVENLYNDLSDLFASNSDIGVLGVVNNLLTILKEHHGEAFVDFQNLNCVANDVIDFGNVSDESQISVKDNGIL